MLFDFSKSPLQNINNLKENKNFNTMSVPIQPKKNDWEIIETKNDKYITKIYSFSNVKHMMYFLSEVLKELSLKNIFPKFTLIESEITVDIIPSFLSEITELEINVTKFIDEIYSDIRYI